LFIKISILEIVLAFVYICNIAIHLQCVTQKLSKRNRITNVHKYAEITQFMFSYNGRKIVNKHTINLNAKV
jgi:hypothetical protein